MMNHAIHKPLFGKQESQESIQESRNQAKNLKIPESRWRKFRVADPSMQAPSLLPRLAHAVLLWKYIY